MLCERNSPSFIGVDNGICIDVSLRFPIASLHEGVSNHVDGHHSGVRQRVVYRCSALFSVSIFVWVLRVRSLRKRVLTLLPVVVLAACAVGPGKFGGSAALENRVEARWSSLVRSDLAGAYAFLSPAARETTSFEKYAGSIKPGLWRSASIAKVDCATEDLCTVDVNVKYVFKPRKGPALENVRALSETWRQVGGEWWFVPAD